MTNSLQMKTIDGVLWKFAERFCAQLVGFLIMVVLARLLTPADFGIIAVVLIFVSFCNVFVDAGFNVGLIQKHDADELDYSTILWFSTIVAFVLYGVLFVLAPYIASIYQMPALTDVLRVMGILLILNAPKSVYSAYISSHLQFRKFFYATSIGILVSAIGGIVAALYGFGVWALVIQQVCNVGVDVVVLVAIAGLHVRGCFSILRFKNIFSYSWKIFVASVVGVLYGQLQPIIIGMKYTGADLAFYKNGDQVPSVLNNSICTTLTSVLFPVLSSVQDSKEKVLYGTRKYMQMTSYLVFPVMIGLLAISENFVRVVFTEKWLPAVPYMQIFCISYMFDVIQKGNLETIKALGRSDLILKLEILKKTAYFIVIVLFAFFTDSPLMLAISCIVNTVIATLLNTYPNRELIGYSYGLQFRDLFLNFVISVFMGIGVLCMLWLPFTPLILMMIQIVVGVCLYFLLSIITNNTNYHELIRIIKLRIRRAADV